MDQYPTVEICVGDLESAIAAEAGGADRIELCDNLSAGGTTPSVGTIAEAFRWLSVPVHVLIRPRAGDFVYTARELGVMRRDIEAAKALGASGVVIGILHEDGRVDRDRTAELAELARPLSVTFHKAIDQACDTLEALDALIAIGVDRVLSSGARPTAVAGAVVLRSMVERAAGRIAVMAGGGLRVEHLETLVRVGGVSEIHLGSAVTCRVPADGAGTGHEGPAAAWSRVDARRVAEIVAHAQALPCPG